MSSRFPQKTYPNCQAVLKSGLKQGEKCPHPAKYGLYCGRHRGSSQAPSGGKPPVNIIGGSKPPLNIIGGSKTPVNNLSEKLQALHVNAPLTQDQQNQKDKQILHIIDHAKRWMGYVDVRQLSLNDTNCEVMDHSPLEKGKNIPWEKVEKYLDGFLEDWKTFKRKKKKIFITLVDWRPIANHYTALILYLSKQYTIIDPSDGAYPPYEYLDQIKTYFIQKKWKVKDQPRVKCQFDDKNFEDYLIDTFCQSWTLWFLSRNKKKGTPKRWGLNGRIQVILDFIKKTLTHRSIKEAFKKDLENKCKYCGKDAYNIFMKLTAKEYIDSMENKNL